MLIECKYRREGGTTVTLFGAVYTFLPTATGEHVCEVTDKAAIDRFLEVSDAYRVYHGDAKPAPAVAPAPVLEVNSLVSGALPAGAPASVDDMDREQLFAYADILGMRKPHPAISDDKLRVNIRAFLDERAAQDG